MIGCYALLERESGVHHGTAGPNQDLGPMKKTPYLAAIQVEPRDPIELLTGFHSRLSATYRCADVDAWYETGAEFLVQGSDGHRVEIVLAELFESKLGNCFVMISNRRSWMAWLRNRESPLIKEIVLKARDWFLSLGLERELWWSEKSFPDFSSDQGWTKSPVLEEKE